VARRPAPEAPGVGTGERWTFGRGDGSGLYIAGDPKRRVKIADFGAAGRIPGSLAHERALIAAQAPLFFEAAIDLVSRWREDGSIDQADHRVGCECGMCSAVVALALAEGGGRCILCGCTQDDACAGLLGEGCAWEPLPGGAQLLCTAHPPKALAEAKQLFARLAR
jgi:hypothetical protein